VSTKVLSELSLQSLRALAASLLNGALSGGLSRQPLQQLVGSRVDQLDQCLRALADAGMTTAQMSLTVEAVAETKAWAGNPTELVELVLSGPDVPGIPISDTSSEIRKLINSATTEVLVIGYAVYQGKKIFRHLAARMDQAPELKVTFCLDIPRKDADRSLTEQIVERFLTDFRQNQWPGRRFPDLFYDPRSLLTDKRSSLHAKCMAIDRRVVLITSANFTDAGQMRNIEAGVLVRERRVVERLVSYFDALIATNQLVSVAGFS